MLRNVYDYNGEREYQNGQVQLYDMIWAYGYNLKSDEIEFLAAKYKISKKVLANLNKYTRPQVLSKNPFMFVVPEFFAENKVIKNNILFIAGNNYVITLFANHVNAYDKIFEKIDDLDYFGILKEIILKDLQENYAALDELENHVQRVHSNISGGQWNYFDEITFIRDQLEDMQEQFESMKYFLQGGFLSKHTESQIEFLKEVKDTFDQQSKTAEKYLDELIQLEKQCKKMKPKDYFKAFLKILSALFSFGIVAAAVALIMVYPEILSLQGYGIFARIFTTIVILFAVIIPTFLFLHQWK